MTYLCIPDLDVAIRTSEEGSIVRRPRKATDWVVVIPEFLLQRALSDIWLNLLLMNEQTLRQTSTHYLQILNLHR